MLIRQCVSIWQWCKIENSNLSRLIIFSRPFQKLTGKNSKDKFFQPFQYSTTHNLENILTSRDGFHWLYLVTYFFRLLCLVIQMYEEYEVLPSTLMLAIRREKREVRLPNKHVTFCQALVVLIVAFFQLLCVN